MMCSFGLLFAVSDDDSWNKASTQLAENKDRACNDTVRVLKKPRLSMQAVALQLGKLYRVCTGEIGEATLGAREG